MDIKKRLEELRQELRKECISQGELIELQSLAAHIDSGDVELLEAAGVPEGTLSARVIIHKNSGEQEVDIFMSDGGAATLHWNQEHMLTTYYQSRVEDGENNPDVWDILAEGKAYMKDWEGQHEYTDEMILDAICWLGGSEDSVITKIIK